MNLPKLLNTNLSEVSEKEEINGSNKSRKLYCEKAFSLDKLKKEKVLKNFY
jgi:hypothetical protein